MRKFEYLKVFVYLMVSLLVFGYSKELKFDLVCLTVLMWKFDLGYLMEFLLEFLLEFECLLEYLLEFVLVLVYS